MRDVIDELAKAAEDRVKESIKSSAEYSGRILEDFKRNLEVLQKMAGSPTVFSERAVFIAVGTYRGDEMRGFAQREGFDPSRCAAGSPAQ